jgi:hypothetical protein
MTCRGRDFYMSRPFDYKMWLNVSIPWLAGIAIERMMT